MALSISIIQRTCGGNQRMVLTLFAAASMYNGGARAELGFEACTARFRDAEGPVRCDFQYESNGDDETALLRQFSYNTIAHVKCDVSFVADKKQFVASLEDGKVLNISPVVAKCLIDFKGARVELPLTMDVALAGDHRSDLKLSILNLSVPNRPPVFGSQIKRFIEENGELKADVKNVIGVVAR